MKILISACLLGARCRYDGASKEHLEVLKLAERHTLVPVCPEQLGGLPTPRTPSERQGDAVCTREGKDVTEAYRRGAEEALRLCRMLERTQSLLRLRGDLRRHLHRNPDRRRRRDGGAAEIPRYPGVWRVPNRRSAEKTVTEIRHCFFAHPQKETALAQNQRFFMRKAVRKSFIMGKVVEIGDIWLTFFEFLI